MSERCELRQLSTNEFPVANSGIPARCLGCLALAESGKTSAAITNGPETYEAAIAEMSDVDQEFDPETADMFHSTLFAAPGARSDRKVLQEWGFDDDGQDSAVTASLRIEFECVVEKQAS